MIGSYIIENGKVKLEEDTLRWAQWYESNFTSKDRIVAHTRIGKTLVSTVFLGVDYSLNFKKNHKPVLWETMIFNNKKFDGYQERYTSLSSAKKGHAKAVKLVKNKK